MEQPSEASTILGNLGEEARDYRHWSDAYIYAATAGTVGAFGVLFAGCSSKILLSDGGKSFSESVFYASLGGMAFCLIWQTHLLSRGLERP
eukprot:UN15823